MAGGSELFCPRCHVPLEEVRTSGGVLYACNRCAGRAVTIELLRKRFMPGSINPLWQHAVGGQGKIGAAFSSATHSGGIVTGSSQ